MRLVFRALVVVAVGVVLSGCVGTPELRSKTDVNPGALLAPVNVYVTVPSGTLNMQAPPYQYLAKAVQANHPFAGISYADDRFPMTVELVYRLKTDESLWEMTKLLVAATLVGLVPVTTHETHELTVNFYRGISLQRTYLGRLDYAVPHTRIFWLPYVLKAQHQQPIDQLLDGFYKDLLARKLIPSVDDLQNQPGQKT